MFILKDPNGPSVELPIPIESGGAAMKNQIASNKINGPKITEYHKRNQSRGRSKGLSIPTSIAPEPPKVPKKAFFFLFLNPKSGSQYGKYLLQNTPGFLQYSIDKEKRIRFQAQRNGVKSIMRGISHSLYSKSI